MTAAAGLTLRSDRLQAELRAEVEFLDTVTDTAPSLLAIVGTDGRIQNVNAAALEVAGHEHKDDVVGRPYWDVFIDPLGAGGRRGALRRAGARLPGRRVRERVHERARRAPRRLLANGAVRDETGAVTAIVSGGLDITMRRKRERELERERDVQTAVFETMPSIMVALARDGTIRDRDADNPSVGANRAFQKAIRWPDEQLVGRPFLDLVVEDDDGRAAHAIATAAAGKASERVESELRSADGTARAFAWSAIPIADVTDRLDGLVLVTGMDVTERRAARGREGARARVPQRDRQQRPEPSLPDRRQGRRDGARREHRVRGHARVRPGRDRRTGLLGERSSTRPRRTRYARRSSRVAAGEPPAERDNTWMTKTGRRLSVAWTCTPLPVMDERTLFLVTGRRHHRAQAQRGGAARIAGAPRARRGRGAARARAKPARRRAAAARRALRVAAPVESRMESDPDAALALLAGAQAELAQALEELRELARGIHPAVLTDRGLRPALETLAARAPVPVELDRPRRAARAGRGGSGVLRGRGVADQRREVRAGDVGRVSRRSRKTACSS